MRFQAGSQLVYNFSTIVPSHLNRFTFLGIVTGCRGYKILTRDRHRYQFSVLHEKVTSGFQIHESDRPKSPADLERSLNSSILLS